jgi:hypothetical protein
LIETTVELGTEELVTRTVLLYGKGTVVATSEPVSVTVMKLEQSDCRSVKGGNPDNLVPVTRRA